MHPVGKTMRWIKKMNDTLHDGHYELYHRAKFCEDRWMRAGCRCENVVFLFVCLFFVTLRVEHRAFEGCIDRVRTNIALPFIGRFRRGLQSYFRRDFSYRYLVRIFIARRRHNFREIAVQNCENPKKSAESLCAPLRIAEGFEKKFYCISLGPRL